jgi:glycolate oxidase subunit GlcD
VTISSRQSVGDPALEELRAIVGRSGVITEPDRLMAYESDALTTIKGRPLAVVFPIDRDELVEVVRVLYRQQLPFVPRGAGTGLAGGAVADGAVIVSTARLDRIIEVDPDERIAIVEPGVITAEISDAAARHGLRYLPDPGSATACTIGGNVAQNAGGPHCLRHGVTSDHVVALEAVLPDGSVVTLDRGADGGLDLVGLFIGSEGTFGIASRITVRLVLVPASVHTALGLFDSLEAAGRAVNGVFRAGIVPVALELIDRATIRVVEQSVFAAGLPTDVAAALIVECEGDETGADSELTVAIEALRAAGAREVRRAEDDVARERMWQARKKAYGALGRLAPDVLVQDAVVPRTRLAELLPAIEQLAHEYALPLANFFHAGDGNLHPNLMFDSADPDQVERVEAAGAAIMRLCVEAGGTITGEHGVGLDKRRYMQLMFGPGELEVLRSLKRAFDPAGLCNPGKMLPDQERFDG